MDARRGAMAVLLLGVLLLLSGIGALALNLAWLTSHQVALRQACAAAALAGASQLLDPAAGINSPTPDPAAAARVVIAKEQAQAFFAANSPAVLRTTGLDPDVVPGWCEDPPKPHAVFARWAGSGPVNSLLVRGVRRRTHGQAVLLWFGNMFGVADAEPAAVAVASMDQRVYGFRPLKVVPAPMVPLLAPAADTWPSGGAGTAGALPDNYSVAPRTGVVGAGPDGVAEITLQAPLASGSAPSGQASAWLWLTGGPADFTQLARQVTVGLEPSDLAALDGQIALAPDGTLLLAAAPAPDATQADALRSALAAIRGQKRIWPVGNLVTVDGLTSCQVTGFVAGRVVDVSQNSDNLAIVVQACTIQTCTGLLRSGMARNPWIGKLILNE